MNFGWRRECHWMQCPTWDWTCECGNRNFARRKTCNRYSCQKSRPW